MLGSAFVLGLLGSLHCLGMCGPIAMAIPVGGSGTWGILIYNLGRIITYAFIGSLLGAIGMVANFAGVQQTLSIVVGFTLLASLVLPRTYNLGNWPGLSQLTGAVKTRLSLEFKKKDKRSLLIIGLLNGFLPCGLVYVAVAASAAGGEWYWGASYMVLFGLGTVPMMMSVTSIRNFMPLSGLIQVKRLIPAFVFLMGCLFILRGLNLGIPYFSPNLDSPGDHHHARSLSEG